MTWTLISYTLLPAQAGLTICTRCSDFRMMKLFAAKNIRSRRVTSTGSDEKAIVNMNGAESALFVNALGKTQLFLSSALSATTSTIIS